MDKIESSTDFVRVEYSNLRDPVSIRNPSWWAEVKSDPLFPAG